MAVRLKCLHGLQVTEHLSELARLRIQVFREWPYLYAGDLAYEAEYLDVYVRSARSIAILVHDGEMLVGASTALPLTDENFDFQRPYLEANRRIDALFYFGESLLLPGYRGQGLGHQFFDLREQHAKSLGFNCSSFASVRRALDDPRSPAATRGLQPFWRDRGYEPNGLTMRLSWRELGSDQEVQNVLDFWERSLI